MTNSTKTSSARFALLCLVALGVALFAGLAAPFIKLALRHLSVFYLLALRFTLGSALFLVFFGRRIVRGLKTAKLAPLLGIALLTAASLMCSNIALSRSSATNTVFLQSISIVLVPIASWFILRQRIRRATWPLIGLILLGVYLMCGGVDFSFGFSEFLLLLNAASGAVIFALSAKYLKGCDWVVLSFCQVGVTALVFWVAAGASGGISPLFALPSEALWLLLFLGVCSCFLMYLGQNLALSGLSPTLVSLIFCSQSVFAAGAAYLFLGERLTSAEALGAGVILLGVVLATLFTKNRETPSADSPRDVRR